MLVKGDLEVVQIDWLKKDGERDRRLPFLAKSQAWSL